MTKMAWDVDKKKNNTASLYYTHPTAYLRQRVVHIAASVRVRRETAGVRNAHARVRVWACVGEQDRAVAQEQQHNPGAETDEGHSKRRTVGWYIAEVGMWVGWLCLRHCANDRVRVRLGVQYTDRGKGRQKGLSCPPHRSLSTQMEMHELAHCLLLAHTVCEGMHSCVCVRETERLVCASVGRLD